MSLLLSFRNLYKKTSSPLRFLPSYCPSRSPKFCARYTEFSLLVPSLNTFLLIQIDLLEEKGSGSLIFSLPKNQLSKSRRALKSFRESANSTSPKLFPDIDETKVKLHKRTETRHAREWVQLHQLAEQQSVHVVHYRQLVRYKIYMLLTKRPYSATAWRRRIILDWDEKLFRAVFGPLGKPTRPTIIRHPEQLAPTLDGAWASSTVRMLQILAVPGKTLQDFLSLEEFQRSRQILLAGYCAKHIDIRFVLELAAIFTCRSLRLPGCRMQVHVYVTVSLATEAGTFHHALPLNNDGQHVLVTDDITEEIKSCCDAMTHWKPNEQ